MTLHTRFQSRGNTAQTLKLVVYSMTPIWVAGVLYLVPALGVLVIIVVSFCLGAITTAIFGIGTYRTF